MLTSHREYLRIVRGRYRFDICAAPFGTGFFFSSWLTEIKSPFGWLYLLAFILAADVAWAIVFGLSARLFGVLNAFPIATVGVSVLAWAVGYGTREGMLDLEEIILTTPFIGMIYENLFNPPTFYNLDTALMFQQAVHNAVLEVIDGMVAAKGLRALSDLERKPILKAFAKSA